MRSIFLLLLLLPCLEAPALERMPAHWLARQAPDLVQMLGQRHAVDRDGAMGRNRKAYFHARFQLGVHQIAGAATLRRDPALAARALDAIEYAFARQTPGGGFELDVPAALSGQRPPSEVDLASGTAFFLASAATALVLLDPPGSADDWLPPAAAKRVLALEPALADTLSHIRRQRSRLSIADAQAPNRLLFTALALQASGLLLEHPSARAEAAAFVRQALAQQHADGYFIEGGGYDSSYNGVACALGLRLLTLDPGNMALAVAMDRAMAWQRGRIAANGEILTAGNTRVRAGGESFLGVRKGVDAAHTVEALMLSAAWRDDPSDAALARAIASHYRRAR